jgi:CheY-like chemotaxis protein
MWKDILLAEDDEDDRILLTEALNNVNKGLKVEFAPDGQKLMALLQSRKTLPDVIFLDLNMPFKNGFQCLREIKGNEKLKKCPVIVMTTSQNLDDINLAYELGAALFLIKPSDFTILKIILEKIITAGNPGMLKLLRIA